jgi:hypothetical protein
LQDRWSEAFSSKQQSGERYHAPGHGAWALRPQDCSTQQVLSLRLLA